MEKRGYPATPRKAITELTATQKLFLEYLLFGCSKPDLCRQVHVEPNTPMSIEQAADLTRIRRRYARWLFEQAGFKREYNRGVEAIRNGARVAAVRRMVEIMGDRGENTAAEKTVSLKAATALLGDESRSPAVNVSVGVNVTAGLVIKLPAGVEPPQHGSSFVETHPISHEMRTIPAPSEHRLVTDPQTLQQRCIPVGDDDDEDDE